MSIIENFLVNTSNFEPIIQALIEDKNVPDKITDAYFKSLGFQNPSDLLVIHLLKGLHILEEDGSTTELFSELKNPDTTPIAIATGVVQAYEDLFEKYPHAHRMQIAELLEAFSDVFQGKKTDLILKYMANTFSKLVSFAGVVNIENALPQEAEEEADSALEVVQEVNGIHKNGNHGVNENGSVQEEGPVQEEEGDKSFEELVGLSSNDMGDTEPPVQEINADKEKKESEEEADSIEDTFGITSEPEEESKTESKEENVFEDFFHQKNGADHNPVEQVENNEAPALPKGSAIKEADEKIQKAIIKKADLLYKLERYDDVLPALDEIITYFDQSDKPFLKEAASRSVIRRATILCNQQKYDQALPALDKVISTFSHSENKEFYEQASVAMLYKAQILETTDQLDQALPLFNGIIERLSNSTNPKIKEQVDSIYLKRLDVLLISGKDDEVLTAADQLIERFRNSGDKLQYLEEAMFKKAEILEKMNRNEEALQAYSEFLEKFGDNISA